MDLIHKILYKTLSLDNYLRVVSRLFFIYIKLGIGRYTPATEYVYHLSKLVKNGDTAIDIGANLGYYSRTLSQIVGESGKVYAVEPMQQIIGVLRDNLRKCKNIEILNYALGAESKEVTVGNDSSLTTGYFGTGQNFINDTQKSVDVSSVAEMRRGSELFKNITSLEFIKCDIEGYEVIVMREMRPILERFSPVVLIETGGKNRAQIVELFSELGYIGYTLERGLEVPITKNKEQSSSRIDEPFLSNGEVEKDIIFRKI